MFSLWTCKIRMQIWSFDLKAKKKRKKNCVSPIEWIRKENRQNVRFVAANISISSTLARWSDFCCAMKQAQHDLAKRKNDRHLFVQIVCTQNNDTRLRSSAVAGNNQSSQNGSMQQQHFSNVLISLAGNNNIMTTKMMMLKPGSFPNGIFIRMPVLPASIAAACWWRSGGLLLQHNKCESLTFFFFFLHLSLRCCRETGEGCFTCCCSCCCAVNAFECETFVSFNCRSLLLQRSKGEIWFCFKFVGWESACVYLLSDHFWSGQNERWCQRLWRQCERDKAGEHVKWRKEWAIGICMQLNSKWSRMIQDGHGNHFELLIWRRHCKTMHWTEHVQRRGSTNATCFETKIETETDDRKMTMLQQRSTANRKKKTKEEDEGD